MASEKCMKMLRNLSEILAAKFPASTLGYFMVKISCIADASLEILGLEASNHCSKKIRKGEKGKAKKVSKF